jgi:hypothetical protein
MSKIQAEESLRTVQETAIASGALKAQDRNAIMRRWQREARGDQKRKRKKLTPEQQEAVLSGMGIKIEWQKR